MECPEAPERRELPERCPKLLAPMDLPDLLVSYRIRASLIATVPPPTRDLFQAPLERPDPTELPEIPETPVAMELLDRWEMEERTVDLVSPERQERMDLMDRGEMLEDATIVLRPELLLDIKRDEKREPIETLTRIVIILRVLIERRSRGCSKHL